MIKEIKHRLKLDDDDTEMEKSSYSQFIRVTSDTMIGVFVIEILLLCDGSISHLGDHPVEIFNTRSYHNPYLL